MGCPKEKEAYYELWKYIVNFQKIPFFLQQTIHILLSNNWLNYKFWDEDKDHVIWRIVLAERSFFQLVHIYVSLIKELFWEDSEDFKIVNKISNFIINNIENKRNDIVHSFIYVDDNDLENMMICREKFKYGSWFTTLSKKEIPKDMLEKQIKMIDEIIQFISFIYLNLEKNNKVKGQIDIKWNKIIISESNTKNFIKTLKEKYL